MSENSTKWHWAEGTKYALEGIKLLFILNGASAVSILTFVGNTKKYSSHLVFSMLLFSLGAFFSVIIMASAYMTQLHYGNADQCFDGAERKVCWNNASRWHFCSFIFLALGMLLFLAGMIFAACSFLNSNISTN